jgi:hypothetical protein
MRRKKASVFLKSFLNCCFTAVYGLSDAVHVPQNVQALNLYLLYIILKITYNE